MQRYGCRAEEEVPHQGGGGGEVEMIGELSSDGGVEGIKAMMVADGWDKKEPRAIMCHSIDAAGAIGGSRWLLMVSEYQHIDLKYNK